LTATAPYLTYARLAIKIIFFLNGFVHANYFSRLPRVQDSFRIDNGTTGLVLLTLSLGAFLAMPFAGWLIIRNGSRKITLFAVCFYCLLVPFIPVVVPQLNLLLLIFFFLGVSSGMLDVAMNAQAVIIEQRWGKPIMTSFHAFFSIGMMFGALAGSLFAKLEQTLEVHFFVVGAICAVAIFSIHRYLIQDKPDGSIHEGPAFRLPNAAMVTIGVIAFCSMLGEGAMDGWTTIYMENVAFSSKAAAPLGLFAFALAMTIGRIFGDGARLKFGDRKLMIYCGLISSLGLLLTLLVTHPLVVIAGFFVIGLGLSIIVPIAYSIAGNVKDLPPGVGIAMVTTVGYSGFMVGPPVIGFLADAFTLRYALLLVVVLFLVMTFLGSRYRAK
jgi:MFS family permease